ncbi:MAG: hypothetical protein ABI555_09385 [Chloroflexota bacterium]
MDQGPAGYTVETVQSVARLEQSIQARASTDRTFINWWIYWLLLSWITLGIAQLVYFYRRMSRVDAFSRRKAAYYEELVEYTERRAESAGSAAFIRPITGQLRADLQAAGRSSLKPLNAGLQLLLSIITLGLWAIVAYYMVNRAWDDRQRFEAAFDDRLSQAWLQLGLLRHPITFRIDEGKHRNVALWFVVSILTFGIGFIVWDYRIHSDPDRLYPEFHRVEDSILAIVRTA